MYDYEAGERPVEGIDYCGQCRQWAEECECDGSGNEG
jgi:hypothetical protein